MRFLIERVLHPISQRIGSAIAGGMVAIGATQEQVSLVLVALTTISGIALDLVLANTRRD